MVEERLICCCRASRWTKAIGWIEITSASTYIVFHIAGIQVVTSLNTVILILVIIFLIMAILLLRGSHNRNPNQLQAWIVCTIILIVLSIIKSIITFVISPLHDIWIELLILPGTVSSLCFSIWAVSAHKKDIKAEGAHHRHRVVVTVVVPHP